MDKRYNILSHLYGEGPTTEPLRSLLREEALRDEYQALSEAKFALDHKDRVSPSAETLDVIFAAAANPAAPKPVAPSRLQARQDRQPARRRRFAMLPVSLASAAAIVAVAIGLNVFVASGDQALQLERAAEAPMADRSAASALVEREAASFAEMEPASPAFAKDSMASAPLQVAASGPASGSFDDATVLAWDEPGDVRLLHRRIQSLREANAALDWDEVGVPLEQLTTGSATRPAGSLQTVGSKRNQ